MVITIPLAASCRECPLWVLGSVWLQTPHSMSTSTSSSLLLQWEGSPQSWAGPELKETWRDWGREHRVSCVPVAWREVGEEEVGSLKTAPSPVLWQHCGIGCPPEPWGALSTLLGIQLCHLHSAIDSSPWTSNYRNSWNTFLLWSPTRSRLGQRAGQNFSTLCWPCEPGKIWICIHYCPPTWEELRYSLWKGHLGNEKILYRIPQILFQVRKILLFSIMSDEHWKFYSWKLLIVGRIG